MKVFQSIVRKLGGCDVDLFASRVNAQLKCVSWRPDPDAVAVDAFTLDWYKFRAFCFPPFSLIPSVLQTLELCQADCVIVMPFRTTPVWFTKLLNYWLTFQFSYHLLHMSVILSGVLHLLPKVKLIACSLSGKPWRTEAVVKILQSCQDGEREQRNVITPSLRSGLNIVMRRVKIPFVPLQTN